jgi:hypothetical protein
MEFFLKIDIKPIGVCKDSNSIRTKGVILRGVDGMSRQQRVYLGRSFKGHALAPNLMPCCSSGCQHTG